MDKISLFIKKNWLLLLAVFYFIIPTDVFPDIIPILGKTDDSFLFILELLKRVNEMKKDEKVRS